MKDTKEHEGMQNSFGKADTRRATGIGWKGAIIPNSLYLCLCVPFQVFLRVPSCPSWILAFLLLCGPVSAQKRHSAPPRPVASPWDVEAREYLGTPESEAAAQRGLAYLQSRQSPDGHWESGGYPADVGITGLCLMAFLASGQQPGRGRYGAALNQAVDFLANQVQMSGQFGPVGLIRSPAGGQPMYGQGFALLALSEAYGMTHRHDLKPKIQAAIKLIEDTQNQDGQPWHDGGWRYQPMQGDADLSVTCRNAGLAVSQSTIDRAIAYMRRCANADGGFSYQVQQNQSDCARAGAGVLSLMLAGMRDSRECQGGLHYLEQHPFDRRNPWPYRDHFHYAIYYVTQAMYQAGGDYWKHWYPVIRDELVRTQNSNGSWERSEYNSDAGGVYASAMSILVLQVPAGLLPIYQK